VIIENQKLTLSLVRILEKNSLILFNLRTYTENNRIMKKTKHLILIVSILMNTSIIWAQQNTISDLMNDGGLSTTTNIIKTDVFEYLKGNIPIIWEHRFSDNFAIEGGIGLLINNLTQPILKYDILNRSIYKGLNGGFSLHIAPSYYTNGFESFHFGFEYNYHNYTNQVETNEINFKFGKQWFITRRFALDLSLGLGLNFETPIDGSSYVFDSQINNKDLYGGEGMRMVVPASIKIGYVL